MKDIFIVQLEAYQESASQSEKEEITTYVEAVLSDAMWTMPLTRSEMLLAKEFMIYGIIAEKLKNKKESV